MKKKTQAGLLTDNGGSLGGSIMTGSRLLIDSEILDAWENDWEGVTFDHKPTPEEILLVRLRCVAARQFNMLEATK
jgi:hypothetical protein